MEKPTDASLKGSLSPGKERESCGTVSDWWSTIYSYLHGLDEGILFLSSSTAVAVASPSVSVSVEGSIVCGTMRLRRRDDP
jgi:hypothetical protein